MYISLYKQYKLSNILCVCVCVCVKAEWLRLSASVHDSACDMGCDKCWLYAVGFGC